MKNLDIKGFSDQLHDSLKAELEAIGRENDDLIARAGKSIVAVRSAISQLKDFVYKYQFSGKDEEIEFFKEIKPVFISQYYYYDKIFTLKIHEPFGSRESINAYYLDQLNQLQAFLTENHEFYRYCLSNATYFDDKYFTRSERPFRPIEIDTTFSTGYDLILSTILANQLVREHLQSLISRLDVGSPGLSTSSLTWTGTKTGLIEIIYALQSMGAFNDGKADIKQVATSFESFFNVSLGNWYRHFQEIRLRKIARTNFIDQMKKALEERLERLD